MDGECDEVGLLVVHLGHEEVDGRFGHAIGDVSDRSLLLHTHASQLGGDDDESGLGGSEEKAAHGGVQNEGANGVDLEVILNFADRSVNGEAPVVSDASVGDDGV